MSSLQPPASRPSAFLRLGVIPQFSPLANQPWDIINSIADYLSWSEQEVLSQTCKNLRPDLHHNCVSKLRTVSRSERKERLNSLSRFLPDHHFCLSCSRLHLTDPNDVPGATVVPFQNHLYQHDPACPFSGLLVSQPQDTLFPYYGLGFRHVQLATKYWRLGGEYLRYLPGLLKKSSGIIRRVGDVTVTLEVEPRIVKGRYLMKMTFRFSKDSGRLARTDVHQMRIKFCRHHPSVDCGINSVFLRYACATPGLSIGIPPVGLFSWFSPDLSRYCPADFVSEVKDGVLVADIWHDMGTGVSLHESPRECDVSWDDRFVRDRRSWRFNSNPSTSSRYGYIKINYEEHVSASDLAHEIPTFEPFPHSQPGLPTTMTREVGSAGIWL